MTQNASVISYIEKNEPLPPPETAISTIPGLKGLVAAGGGLSVNRLLEAYSQGIFPWFSKNQPVLWWSPDPRMVLKVDSFKLHRSLKKNINAFLNIPGHAVKFDSAFDEVIHSCAQTQRPHQEGTWILDDMIAAYRELHAHGFAHSVEIWAHEKLVGGLYCVSIGHCIFGESMFSHQSNASKIALAALVAFAKAHGVTWIDCQQNTKHLASLGAQEISRSQFLKDIAQQRSKPPLDWSFRSIYWIEIMANRSLD